MDFETLATLVRPLRPGMTRPQIDALVADAAGMISAHILDGRKFDEKEWTHPFRRPCTVVFDDQGIVDQVNFEQGVVTIPGLEQGMSQEDFLTTYPDARLVQPTRFMIREGFRTYAIRIPDETHFAIVHFSPDHGGTFHFTTKDGVDQFEQRRIEANAADERRERERKIERAKRQKELDEQARAHREFLDRLSPDERLRYWAKSYTAWGESSGLWQRLTEFLIEHSTPEDRHLLIEVWNWDHGVEVPLWIARQPDTARATAIVAFWKAEPFYEVMRTVRSEPGRAESELILEIGRNLSRQFYETKHPPEKEIAYTGPPYKWADDDDDEARHRAIHQIIPPEAISPIPGREVALTNTPWRFPVELEHIC